MTTTATLVADYTARFSAHYLDDHSVGSGLGVWLLLALLAPATEGEDRRRLETELGTDADDAASRAARLLADPHPAVQAAVAVWDRSEILGPLFATWSSSLPEQVERGAVPTQAEADAWADRVSLGMLPTFPSIDPSVAVLLASALATDVTWVEPFYEEDARSLEGAFGSSITLGLRARKTHTQLLADTDAAGIVAVHAARAEHDLRVISVIGPPDASPGQMHLAALQVARLLAANDSEARPVDLWDLELGDGHAWTLTEEDSDGKRYRGDTQEVRSMLAAWSVRSVHDLAMAPGVADAIAALARFLADPSDLIGVSARQSAVAEFTRDGFRAAAITDLMLLGAGHPAPPQDRFRRAEVRFNRPYAVLAIALGPRDRVSSWAEVPVFSAWVGRVDDTPHLDRHQQAVERRAEMRSRSGPVEG